MVKDGRVIAGTGASLRVGFGNLMASMGVANPRLIDELVTTDLVGAELNRAAGEFAKSYYGPQISNQDVVNAKEAIGAMQSNSKERLEAVLGKDARGSKKENRALRRQILPARENAWGFRSAKRRLRGAEIRAGFQGRTGSQKRRCASVGGSTGYSRCPGHSCTAGRYRSHGGHSSGGAS
jgi:hypothetical protein